MLAYQVRVAEDVCLVLSVLKAAHHLVIALIWGARTTAVLEQKPDKGERCPSYRLASTGARENVSMRSPLLMSTS